MIVKNETENRLYSECRVPLRTLPTTRDDGSWHRRGCIGSWDVDCGGYCGLGLIYLFRRQLHSHPVAHANHSASRNVAYLWRWNSWWHHLELFRDKKKVAKT